MSFTYPVRRWWLALALLVSLLLMTGLRLHHTVAASSDPVTAAWERARAAGSYHFTSDITQLTIPQATLTNVGRSSRSEKLYLEGQNDLRAEQMTFTLWSEGGSVLQAESGIAIRTEGGKAFARRGAGEWEEIDDFTGSLAPQGDFLSYLAALKDVQRQAAEQRGGIRFTRYTFAIDSARFAASMHQQMEATLRARGELPPGLRLDVPAYFRDMVGSGELWVGEDGLPLRQILTLQFPPQAEEQVQSQIVVDFSKFGSESLVISDQLSVNSQQLSVIGRWLGTDHWSLITDYFIPFTILLSLLAGAALLIFYRRVRLVQAMVAILVIFSQVAGPLLTTYTNVQFFDTQTAKAAVQKERQAAANYERDLREVLGTVEFNPHLSPLESATSGQSSVNSDHWESVTQSPALQSTDSGLDSDGDTLTDFTEERIGTSSVISDTDGDGLNDNIEVNGFDFGGQRWHPNPDAVDSNGDGQGDALEWGLNGDGSLRTTPLDSDGDGFPDLFDMDNDGDGVPDNKDLSLFAKGATAYSQAAPLQLTLNNLTAGKPAFVDFQIRPQDEKQLWFAFNVLDWPQDSEGQVRDVDGKTYADVATSAGRTADASEANGDMKVVPMLEIRIPANSANLPPQSDLTPFNITVNNFTADAQIKVAYVPLTIVTDEKTGQRVAFSGQMRYLPTGNWPSPHQVRLAWVVQALVDLPCDKATDTSADCQADGYRNNVPQMIQSYYGNWTLTGMTVHEEHGADMAIFYEDPAVDDNKQDDAAIWALSHVLERHFTVARDTNQDGQRDLTVADLSTRFDRDNNPSDDQRMGVPDILQVVIHSYPTVDQAIASTTMTETAAILNTVFKAQVENDRQIKPLLLFGQEQRTRQLTLNLALAGGGYVTQNGANLTLDMAPSGGGAAQTVDVIAGVKWMGYCTPADGPVSLTPCDDDIYWEELDRRYAALPALPEDQSPDWMGGRLQFAQLYYTSLRSGFYATVQTGQTVPHYLLPLENESATATALRGSLRATATVPVLAGLHFTFMFPGGELRIGQILSMGAELRQAIRAAEAKVKAFSGGFSSRNGQIVDPLLISELQKAKNRFQQFRIQQATAALSVLQVAFQILSFLPDLPLVGRGVLRGLSILLNLGISVIMPSVALFRAYSATTFIQLLNGTATVSKAMKIGGAVGAVIGVAIIWGFFIYGAVEAGLTVGSPALNRAFFEAVAATVITILLVVLALNPVGMIIAALLGVIDALLTLICEMGVDKLRQVPGQEGTCFTITGTITKYLTKLLYSYDLMINMERNDLILTGAPQVTLADPSKGYAAGNVISLTLPVTTTAVHKDPDPNNGVLIYPYMYLFSEDNLKRSAFQYSLTNRNNDTPAVALDQMTDRWQNVEQDHTYLVSPMYRGALSTLPAPLTGITLPMGVNQTIPLILNMSYAIPAYECWTLVVIPICYPREFKGDNHMPITSLKYDVLPATLDEFLTLNGKPNGGLGQSWDARFGSLRDADGDGLLSFAYNGLDPNDTTADTDGDGLTDRYELERQMAGIALSPIQRDTDRDGLTDWQEIRLGSDPAVADSDNDGLKDGEEVYHLRDGSTTWEGGWDVTISGINGPVSALTVRVSSDPFRADSDNDGLSDLAERQLAQDANPANRVDNQNRPYHPQIPNSPPLALLVETDDLDGYLAPGQSLRYTNTVIAHTAVAPGVLNVTPPSVMGNAINPLALGFNPLTFTSTQTVTQPINLTVAQESGTQQTRLSSTASTRLKDTGVATWSFAPVTAEAPLGGIVAPALPYYTDVTASRPDRQDNFLLSALAVQMIGGDQLGFGDILAYSIPGGGVRAIENDASNMNAILGNYPPQLATNASGDTLAVWRQKRYCNDITLNSLRVVTAGADSDAASGIEPQISFKAVGVPELMIWSWDQDGGTSMTSGQQRGPNAFGFPMNLNYCGGPLTLNIYDNDGASNELVEFKLIDLYAPLNGALTFTGAGHTIELNVTVPLRDQAVIAGGLVGSDGRLKRSITFPRSPVPTSHLTQSYGPVVASDGNGFLVAYESFAENPPGAYGLPQIVIQAFDKNGNPLNTAYRAAGSSQLGRDGIDDLAIAAAWTGNSYRLVWQDRREPLIYMASATADGQSLTAPQLFAIGLANGSKTEAPGIAYDPVSGRTLIVTLAANREINGRVYAGDTIVAAKSVHVAQFPAARSPQVAWHPGYQGWLLSYQDNTAAQNHVFVPLDSNGDPAFASTTGFLIAANDNSLACPAPQSYPLVDLRFEELPGVTTFVDSSGRANNATCAGAACSAAGAPGAPNAPRSDYAVRFDGVDDGLTLNRTIQDDFSITFWIKAPTANMQQMLVDGGDPAANGFQIFLNNGALAVNVPGFNAQAVGRIDDGQWHFVTITRNKTTGRVEASVDGNGVIGVLGTADVALNGAPDLRIGKSRANSQPLRAELDQLQIFPVVLGGDTLQAIYNRTNQSYCVAAGASGSNVYWAKVQASQPDLRGGQLSASNGLTLTIDNDLPIAQITAVPNNAVVAPGQVIGGTASDATSGVGLVEISINNGPWTPAEGADTWTFSLAGQNGAISLRVRATDNVGNIGNPSALINLTVDGVVPTVTINAPAGAIKPSKNASGLWQVNLTGTASDAASGINADAPLVRLEQQSGVGMPQTDQPATLSGNAWTINYLLDPGLYDPTGSYTVTVRASDNMGNTATPATAILRLDASGPNASLSNTDIARQVISQTLTIGGVISDTNSSAGIDKLEIAFTPVEQLAALPGGLTSEQAEAQLNRVWTPVTLAQHGAGVTTTTWSFAILAGLENSYQIDLRGTDMLGNVAISGNLWRGLIDTQNPRIVMSATATGASYFDRASNTQLYQVHFVCAAVDRNLQENAFVCPGKGLAEPIRSFDNQPVLQTLFPDLTIRTGLALSYTLWSADSGGLLGAGVTASACDTVGRCASASASGASLPTTPAATAPRAVIVAPADGSFVAANQTVSVTVAAEASAALQRVTITLDNTVVQTLSLTQADAATRILRTIGVPVATEGPHTLVAQATDWANVTQTTLYPVTFTLDRQAPSVTIDASPLTIADTWQAQSGILRFHGTASDSVGLAAVQIREGDNGFVDATFGNGTWRVALPVADPEGRTLNVTVRASDRAGRSSEVTQTITTALSAADAPDTTINSGAADPSADNTATFTFAGSASAVAFDCSLDDGVYTPCASPTSYSDLSKGSHTFRVRAIDGRGYPDLSSAEYTWTVNASALDVTLSTTPSHPTPSRSAQFAFTGNGSSFECRLDGATFSACTSPQSYTGLTNGAHTFQVRTRSGDTVGAAARFVWTVVNAAPVTNDQTVTTDQDTAIALTLQATDEDALTYQVGTPAHGVLIGIPPTLTYSPNTGYSGTDSFTFSATDGLTQSNLGTVMIDVQGGQAANRAPVAVDDGLPTTSEIVAQGRITLTTLLANDSDPDDTTLADGACTNCSIVATGQASQGTVTLVGGQVTYVATNPTFRGTDTFTYTLSDNDPRGALTATAQVAVTVQADATPGDCNANGTIDAGDLTALGLEIFDGDGNRWSDAALGSVAFSPYGCDANADAVIDAGDLTCTARRIFDTAFVCGGVTAAQASPASLAVGADLFAQPGDTVDVPIVLTTNGHGVAAAAFSLHWDAAQLQFEATDVNADGTPAAVTFHLPEGLLASATYHAEASRLDLVVLGLAQPLPQLAAGPLVTVRLSVPNESTTASPALSLSTASLGSDTGQSIPLTLTNGTVQTPTQTFQLLLPLVSR